MNDLAAAVGRISRAQHAQIHLHQLRALGLTRHAIRKRVERGRLVPTLYNVFCVCDPALIALALPAAALLSIGVDAVLSHRSAAAVWGVAQPDPDNVDVTVPGRSPRSRPGVRLHRVARLAAADQTTRDGLRVTGLARTLIDFAEQASTAELHHAFGEARAKHRLKDRALSAALTRVPHNHPGAAVVRRMLASGGGYDRSLAERKMRALCEQAQLPLPATNVMLNGFLVDFLWHDQRLIVEVDGSGTHDTRQAFEQDRRRDQIHAAAGYLVIRVTWEMLKLEPVAVVARLAAALAHRAG